MRCRISKTAGILLGLNRDNNEGQKVPVSNWALEINVTEPAWELICCLDCPDTSHSG